MFHLHDGLHCQWSRNPNNGDRILSSTALLIESDAGCEAQPGPIQGRWAPGDSISRHCWAEFPPWSWILGVQFI